MTIMVCEAEEWEHESCLRLRPQHKFVCLEAWLHERSAAQHPDAEVTEEALRRILDTTLAIEVLAQGRRRTSYRMWSEFAPGAGGP